MVSLDKQFPTTWPFGVLKTIHWCAPLAALITIWLAPYHYSSIGFVLFTAWNAFIVTFVTWLCYLFEVQRNKYQFGAAMLFVPFALIDFIVAIVGTLCFAISSLIGIIALIHAFGYSIAHVFSYFFATAFCLISGAAFAYFALLLYRQIPNGQFRNLLTMIILGDRISTLEEEAGGSGGPTNYGGGGGMPGGRPPI